MSHLRRFIFGGAELRIPEEHVGYRLEDMLLITPDGYENLSRSVPIEASDIETFMAAPLPADLRQAIQTATGPGTSRFALREIVPAALFEFDASTASS